MSQIICESEGTVRGTVQVTRTEAGTFDVATAEEGGDFEIRHPSGDADSAIRALGHYLHGEAYHRRKAASKLHEMKKLIAVVLAKDYDDMVIIDPNDSTLNICTGCQKWSKIDEEDDIEHDPNRHFETRREATEILLQMIKE